MSARRPQTRPREFSGLVPRPATFAPLDSSCAITSGWIWAWVG